MSPRCGAVAQLGERLVRNEEASGSIPLSSTNPSHVSPTVLRSAPAGSHPRARLKFDALRSAKIFNNLRHPKRDFMNMNKPFCALPAFLH